MRTCLVGLVIGLILGGSAAYAAGVYGDGYLFGWTVTKDGEEVCDAPFIWSVTKEIECN